MYAGAIKAIYSGIDFSKDGINDIAVGRDTGSLEIYGFDQQQQPVLLFSTSLEESINSIDGGYFTSPNVQVQTHLVVRSHNQSNISGVLGSTGDGIKSTPAISIAVLCAHGKACVTLEDCHARCFTSLGIQVQYT